MFFYKKIKDGEFEALQTCCNRLEESDTFVNITEAEYTELSALLKEKGARELAEEIEKSKTEEQRYTEMLEKENAELLFRLLTGEELADV